MQHTESLPKTIKIKNFLASSVICIGPPASGKKSLATLLAKTSGACYLDRDNLIETCPIALQKEFGKDMSKTVIN